MESRRESARITPPYRPQHVEFSLENIRANLHPDIRLTEEWILSLPRLSARSDEPNIAEIDLSSFWLPANSVYPVPQPITEQPRFAACMVLAVSAYWSSANTQKTRDVRAKSVASSLAKFLEFAWMKDKFELSSWTKEDFRSLATELAEGGWQHALKIKDRLLEAYEKTFQSDFSMLLRPPNGLDQGSICTATFQAQLGTNVQGQEVKIYHKALVEGAPGLDSKIKDAASIRNVFAAIVPKRPSTSMLRETFAVLNYAYDLPFGLGLSALPFEDGHISAKKLGRPCGRTANLTADQAARLFAESFRWVYSYGPKIVILLGEICEAVIQSHEEGRVVLGHDLDDVLQRSSSRQWLDQHLPMPVKGIDVVRTAAKSLSVRELILSLMSACFFLAATMNARRKDEISHRRFGLHKGCVKMVDEVLGLFEGEFYVEKTVCDYVSFYVNKATRDVVQLLEGIQILFDEVDVALGRGDPTSLPARERSLFTYRRISRIEGIRIERCWFDFEGNRPRGNARRFVEFALGEQKVKITPHMFRRAYALIFYYRYSNATLQALSFQMRHHSLGTTFVYVTDPWFVADAASIAAAFKDGEAKRQYALSLEARSFERKLGEVADELLIETVSSLLAGEPSLGSYARFVRFVHSKLSASIKFDEASLREASIKISSILRHRGHRPLCMPHGQCMAGTTRSIHLARCNVKGELGWTAAGRRQRCVHDVPITIRTNPTW